MVECMICTIKVESCVYMCGCVDIVKMIAKCISMRQLIIQGLRGLRFRMVYLMYAPKGGSEQQYNIVPYMCIIP